MWTYGGKIKGFWGKLFKTAVHLRKQNKGCSHRTLGRSRERSEGGCSDCDLSFPFPSSDSSLHHPDPPAALVIPFTHRAARTRTTSFPSTTVDISGQWPLYRTTIPSLLWSCMQPDCPVCEQFNLPYFVRTPFIYFTIKAACIRLVQAGNSQLTTVNLLCIKALSRVWKPCYPPE
jgi:hypothetical protein